MFQKIIHFIKYNNAFSIGFMLIFVGFSLSLAASPDFKENLISSQEIVRSVDNSGIISADLGNFNFGFQIKSIAEDDKNYYLVYIYKTLAIKDYIWQEIEKENALTVSKEALAERDLGLYAAEELGEVIDYESAYLKEVQRAEKEKGLTPKIATIEYSGLIGKFLSPGEKVFEGYQPIVQEKAAFQPQTAGEYVSIPSSRETPQPIIQQAPVDKELIRQLVQEILTQQPTVETPIPMPEPTQTPAPSMEPETSTPEITPTLSIEPALTPAPATAIEPTTELMITSEPITEPTVTPEPIPTPEITPTSTPIATPSPEPTSVTPIP